MKTNNHYSITAIVFFAFCLTIGGYQSVAQTPEEEILKKIETYQAPPYPESGFISKETYDYRIESKAPVPPTLTDVFICDLYQRMTKDLNLKGITPTHVSEEDVIKSLNVYVNKDWLNIAGYRPWTHWNFIRSLNKGERRKLAQEVVAYMAANGVKEITE